MEADDACVTKYGESLKHFSTLNTARDMEMIRIAMGFDQIDYLGISYGTYLGAVYATMYPDNVHAMFLDAAYDPQGDSPEQEWLTQAVGFEESFDAWIAWCEDTPDECAFSSEDVRQGWFDLEQQLDIDPIELDDGRFVNASVLETATNSALYARSDWPFLADALAKGRDGRGAVLMRMADSWVGRDEDGVYDSSYDAFSIIQCASGAVKPAPDDPEALLDELQEKAPWYSREYEIEDLGESYCSVEPGELVEIEALTDAPIVVLGGTNDPATPIRWSEEMTANLGDSAVLVTFEGEGHSHILESRCVDEIARKLFTSGRLPASGTRCQPDVPVPEPTWWDSVVTIDAPLADQGVFDWYFGVDRVDLFAEFYEIKGSSDEAFAEVRSVFESNGWVYEQGDTSDPVESPQWFYDPDDDMVAIGVLVASPEELLENQISGPDGSVAPNTSVVLMYYWP
jgi:pimeloyl-ACP methyl ester carboxylesterase